MKMRWHYDTQEFCRIWANGGITKERNPKKENRNAKTQVGSATSPEGFMSSTRILQDIIHMLENSKNVSQQEHKLILAYIAAHIIYV